MVHRRTGDGSAFRTLSYETFVCLAPRAPRAASGTKPWGAAGENQALVWGGEGHAGGEISDNNLA